METIELVGLEVFAYHGVNPEEKRDGQTFVLDIYIKADLSTACKSDKLDDTLNYAAVRKCVTATMTETAYNLIERAADRVAQAVLTAFPIAREITVRLKKPNAPMNATFDYVAVTLTRTRADYGL